MKRSGFEFEMQVDSSTLTINAKDDYWVDWGDGSGPEIYTGQSHEYDTPGTYKVSFYWGDE